MSRKTHPHMSSEGLPKLFAEPTNENKFESKVELNILHY